MNDSELYREHVEELELRALAGDDFAIRSLACMALLARGWRYGNPDLTETPPDDGGGGENVFVLADYRQAA